MRLASSIYDVVGIGGQGGSRGQAHGVRGLETQLKTGRASLDTPRQALQRRVKHRNLSSDSGMLVEGTAPAVRRVQSQRQMHNSKRSSEQSIGWKSESSGLSR